MVPFIRKEKKERKKPMNVIVMDTETTNSLEDPICYDIGWAVVDKRGKVYDTKSFVNADIFLNEKELMKSLFYTNAYLFIFMEIYL